MFGVLRACFSLFNSVGYPGPAFPGAEPGVAATAPAYPLHSGSAHLVPPPHFAKGKGKSKHDKFDIFRHWGSLSPWYSVEQGAFGVDSSPEAPETCRITGVHLLHRHGARYPEGGSELRSRGSLFNLTKSIVFKRLREGLLALLHVYAPMQT